MAAKNDKRKRHATGKRTPGIFFRLDRHGERAYEITWRTSDGRQHWQRVHGNLDDAKDALAAKRKERHTPTAKSSKTFGQVVEEYKRSEYFTDLAASTRANYEKSWKNYILPTFEDTKVAAIDTGAVADWLTGLRTIERKRGKGILSAWTRRGALTALRVVLGFAVDERYIPTNPVNSLPRQRMPKVNDERGIRVLDGKELTRLLENTPERSRLMLTVAATTGLRSRELRGLTWTDLDLEAGKLTVQRQLDHEDRGERVAPKTPAARRTRPLPPYVVAALRDIYAKRAEWGDTEGFVFQRDGRPVTVGQLGEDFSTAVEKAGIDDHGKRLSPHCLRHGYGSMLIAAGEDVVKVSRALGHANVSITLRAYSHEFESQRGESDERALQALEDFAPTLG
jgi:integrase